MAINPNSKEGHEKIFQVIKCCLEELGEEAGLNSKQLEKYYAPESGRKSMESVFKQFIIAAQNSSRRTNVIKAGISNKKGGNEEEIKRILYEYDVKRVAALNESDLLEQFREAFTDKNGNFPEYTWRIWTCAVIDSARFLSTFGGGAKSFYSAIDDFQKHDLNSLGVIEFVASNIRNMGFALACDAIKELGYDCYPKPDQHIKDVCSEIGLCSKNNYKVFKTIRDIAESCGETPYKVDKMIWLICTGEFYKDSPEGSKDSLSVPGKKEELIKRIKEALGAALSN